MHTASIVFSALGALGSLGASAWLMWGFNPLDEKYAFMDGGNDQDIRPLSGVQVLLQEQSRVGGLAILGATLQLVGVVLAIWD